MLPWSCREGRYGFGCLIQSVLQKYRLGLGCTYLSLPRLVWPARLGMSMASLVAAGLMPTPTPDWLEELRSGEEGLSNAGGRVLLPVGEDARAPEEPPVGGDA